MPSSSSSGLAKTLVFHDGRFVRRPTPFGLLLILLWLPAGLILMLLRLLVGLLPHSLTWYGYTATGIRVRVKGVPPPPLAATSGAKKPKGRQVLVLS
jgi:hypothetical protein